MNRWIAVLIAFALGLPLSAETLTYRETSQGKTTKETASLSRIEEGGLVWEVVKDKEGTSKAGRSIDGTLQAVEVDSPEGRWTLKVEGANLKASGTYQGKPVTGALELKGRLWSLGFDQPLRWAVQKKLTTPLPFLMANPVEVAKPTEMILTPDGKDSVEGKPALRFKLGLPGAMSLFWSALVWADPVTGEQLKYQGNKGPGTPDVVLLIERAP